MTIDQIVNKFREKPYLVRMGSGKLSKRLKSSIEDVKAARAIYRGESAQAAPVKLPKILIFDIETTPMKAYVWRLFKQNIAWDHVLTEWYMLAWSAKWLYGAEVMGDVLTSEEAIKEDDSRIVKSLWCLINEADIVIAHNAKKADIPWMNTRFILNGLVPPKPYHIIDTLEVAQKRFGFASNKLDALAGYFGFNHKLRTDFDLWEGCINGDEESLHYMLEYNKMDTAILELVYLKLRPWVLNHPNCGRYIESSEPLCSSCGSDNLELIKDKYYYTSVNKYPLYRCKDCGTVVRGRYPIKDVKVPMVPCGR